MNVSMVLLKNFVSSMVVKLAAPLSSFIVFTLIARGMGVEVVGQYTLLASLFMIFQFLSSLGLSPMIVRDIANQRQTPAGIYSQVAAIGLGGLVVWVPLLIGIAWAGKYPHDLLVATLVLAACLPFAFFCMINEALFMGIEKFQFIPIVNIAEAIYLMAGSLAVMASGLGIIGLTAVLASGKIIAAAAGFWIIQRKTSLRPQPLEPVVIRHVIKIMPAFFLNFAFAILYYRVDILQLSWLVPERDVGLYSAAYKLFMMAAILPESFSTALYPRLAARAAHDGNVHEASFRALRYVMIGLTPILLTLIIFGKRLLVLLFGVAYLDAAPAQMVLIWLLLPYAATTVLSNLFLACDQLWFTAGITVFAVLAVVGLNFLLIGRLGFPGAALSLVIVQILCSILMLFYMKKRMCAVNIYSDYLVLFVPALAGGVIASLWSWGGEWGSLFVTMTVTLFLISALKIVGRRDLEWLRHQFFPARREGQLPT